MPDKEHFERRFRPPKDDEERYWQRRFAEAGIELRLVDDVASVVALANWRG